jgi:hypothetical protein
MSEYSSLLADHYQAVWGPAQSEIRWLSGSMKDLDDRFSVLVFAPSNRRSLWTYATHRMSEPSSEEVALELHLLSPVETLAHVELLTAIAHYHRTGRALDLGHTVNFGRPWLPSSKCEFGLISLPYLDGPKIERLEALKAARCYWLIPITASEREYKKQKGLNALEELFQKGNVDYSNPKRSSVV